MLFKNYDQIILNGETPELQKKRKDILNILTYALDAVDPYNATKDFIINNLTKFNHNLIDFSKIENVYVVGFGKASIGMAKAVFDNIKVAQGVIITNETNFSCDYENLEVIIGGHPIPNQGSITGAQKIIELLKNSNVNDLIIVLISGGGSALLCNPRVSLNTLQITTDLLLKSGADISEINTIRKHLSYVKGGQLVKYSRSKILSLIISDIVNDPLEFIASGPTSPDSTTFLDSKKIFEKYDLWDRVLQEVIEIINDGLAKKIPETLKSNDPEFERVYNLIIANNEIACKAAVRRSIELGYKPKILTTSLTGEARDISHQLLNQSDEFSKDNNLFISGGEPTVTVKGLGKGGRNQEFVLSIMKQIADTNTIIASFATDGIDGKSDAAGAIADGFSLDKSKKRNLNLNSFLENNNSYEFFKELGDLFITGPSGTNVMDIQIIMK